MQQENIKGSQSAAQHPPFLTSDRVLPDTKMHDVDESSVADSAMADVRIDEGGIRTESAAPQHQHLGLVMPTQTPADAMDTCSPTDSVGYQPAIDSPTTSSFPDRLEPEYDRLIMSPAGSKRSIAYFTETGPEDLCNETKRRRRETYDVVESDPQPSPTTARVAQSLRFSASRPPPISRCRSLSLPDQSTLKRIAQTGLDLHQASAGGHSSRGPACLLLLPSLSSDSLPSPKSRRFRDRPIPPPITRASLRELETPEILKNAQLIHDIIHDPSLQFRPNLEGPRGERKRKAAEEYWSALEREVDRLKICLRKDPSGYVRLSSNRFPILFQELRDILSSLLPYSDRALVEEVIDPDFLCQQLYRGILDVTNISAFLGRTMKEHCAPMRDSMVEKMMKQFRHAQETGQTQAFVLGLRMVFELLEGMKLDVANHQLRTMKKDLQDRAVSNERDYFEERIAKGKVEMKPVFDWIRPALRAEPSLNPFTNFSKAFVNLLSPSSTLTFPATFLFDLPRLNNFRKDFRDLVSVQLCLLLYRELSTSMHPTSQPPSEAAFNALRLEIWSLLCDLPEATKYSVASPALAVQIALRATQHTHPNAIVPQASLVNVAQRWLDLNIAGTASKMFQLAERRVQDYFVEHLVSAQSCCIAQSPLRLCDCEGRIVWATGTESAMWLLGERMHRVASFHWTVFGDVYMRFDVEIEDC